MKNTWLPWCLSLLVVAFGITVAGAQDSASPAADTAAEEAAPGLLDEDVDVSKIEEILRGEEEVMQGGILGYDPAGRRDPFRSLLRGFEDTEEEGPARERPPGLPGMLVEELTVEGIIQTPTGIMAFVLGRDNVSYIIRPGTKLYNGEVAEIQPKKVVFRQYVNDPGRLKPYDEIVRDLSD
jgi:hypothetical protein